MKRKFAIVSYNIHGNFTNYGSALQTYALQTVVNSLNPNDISAIVLDYCPDSLRERDILNPGKFMWDQDEESKRMLKLSMPAIIANYHKLNDFFSNHYKLSQGKYTSDNFNDSIEFEGLFGYICGSDTVWCIRESSGFDDGFFGNFHVMKSSHTIAYAASFGDTRFTDEELTTLNKRLRNFKAISVRESSYINYLKNQTSCMVQRVLDPTLLLTGSDYDCITATRQYNEPYILLYSRRYNPEMEKYAENLAKKYCCKIVDISLRAMNADQGHIMRYDAGVEEFLSLIKYAKFVITNSFHGLIFSVQMHTPFVIFSREQADNKIDEILDMMELSTRKMVSGTEHISDSIDFAAVEHILKEKRKSSLEFLCKALEV